MSEKVDQFCDNLKNDLNAAESRLQAVKERLQSAKEHTRATVEAKLTEAKADLHLPDADDVYSFDAAVGLEYFWVWSCAAPLTDKRAENQAVANLSWEIDRGEPLTDALALRAAPPICTQGFAFVLDHR